MPAFVEENCESTSMEIDGKFYKVPDEFICPITLECMRRPLMDQTGRSFERYAILNWLKEHRSCPVTRKPMRPSGLISNRALELKIWCWKESQGIECDEIHPYQDSARTLEPFGHVAPEGDPEAQGKPERVSLPRIHFSFTRHLGFRRSPHSAA